MSDTFCILPFLHINAYPDKKLKVCCYSQTFLENTNLENDSISDAFNSDEYKQIRLDMLNGEKPKFCDVCYKMDEEGAESYRTKWNNYYSHLIQKYKNKTIIFSETALLRSSRSMRSRLKPHLELPL